LAAVSHGMQKTTGKDHWQEQETRTL